MHTKSNETSRRVHLHVTTTMCQCDFIEAAHLPKLELGVQPKTRDCLCCCVIQSMTILCPIVARRNYFTEGFTTWIKTHMRLKTDPQPVSMLFRKKWNSPYQRCEYSGSENTMCQRERIIEMRYSGALMMFKMKIKQIIAGKTNNAAFHKTSHQCEKNPSTTPFMKVREEVVI